MGESFSLSDVSSYCESEMNIPDESEIDPRVGVIFHPTHEEIIQILEHKSSHRDYEFLAVFDANIYDHEPDALQGLGAIRSNGKFYFFCPLKPLDGSGERFNRSTRTGYWKVTGRKFTIKARSTHEEIGTKKTLVFYKRFPGSPEEKTNWVMHEYSANNNSQDLVVCKIKEKKEKVRKEDKKRKGRKEEEKLCISTGKGTKRGKKDHISTNDDRNHSESQILVEQGSTSSCISNIDNDVRNSLLGSSSSSQGSKRNLTESPMPPEQGFSSSSQGSNLPDQGSSSSNVSSMENDECNSLMGPSSSSAGSNGNHRQLLMLQEQGFSPSNQGYNLPKQGSSSYSVFSNENDVSNSPGSEWDFSALFSPIEFVQPIVVFPDAECNSLVGPSSSSAGSNGIHRQSLMLQEQGLAPSSQGYNLPEQGSSSYSVFTNENDVSNSLGSECDFSALFSLIECLQQIVVFPDDSVANVNHHAVEDTSLVDPLPLENLNVLNGSTRLNQISISMSLSSTTDGFQPEPQLSPSCYLISDPQSDAVGNANPEWHYYSVSNVNNHAVEDTSLVDSLPLENLNVLNGSIRLDQTSFSMQSQILPEHRASSSSVSINENGMLNSFYGSENQGEDYLQEEWLWVALDEYLNE